MTSPVGSGSPMVEIVDLGEVEGCDVETYCERCYQAPQLFQVELWTDAPKGMEPATTVAAFISTCGLCGTKTRFEAVRG